MNRQLVVLFAAVVSGCGGGGGGSSFQDLPDSECQGTGDCDLVIDSGVAYRLDPGRYEFLTLEVHGDLRVDSGAVKIFANKIVLTGHINASASGRCKQNGGTVLSGGYSISLVAEAIEYSGIISSNGGARSCTGQGSLVTGRTSNGGRVHLEGDSINFSGNIYASGGDGFAYSCSPGEGCSLSGGKGGTVTIVSRSETLPILAGSIYATGGDGGDPASNVDGTYAGSGGSGGTVELEPAGAYTALTIDVSGGSVKACADCDEAPGPGGPGMVEGLL